MSDKPLRCAHCNHKWDEPLEVCPLCKCLARSRVLLDLYLPVNARTVGALQGLLGKEFPHAVIGDAGRDDVLRIYTEPLRAQEAAS